MNILKSVYILLSLVAIMIFSACKKDFLEILPKGKLIATNTEDYELMMNNRSLFIVVGDNNFYDAGANAVMGDEVVSLEPYFTSSNLRFQRLFRFEDNIYNVDQNAVELEVPMQHIYIYNKIINEVMSSKGGSEEKKRSIRAEALIGRAWTYFYLINYYGNQYKETSASTDPGFPIIIENDLTATNFSRNTVKEVYNFILDDLTLALQDAPAIVSRLRPSKLACEGLLGKVYTYMGKYDLALQHFNNALNDAASSSIKVEFQNYANLTHEPPFGLLIENSRDNIEVVYAKIISNGFWYRNNELLISSNTYSLFSKTDFRLMNYESSTVFGDPYPVGFYRKVSPVSFQIGITMPDLIMLRAECLARLGQINDAVIDLEILRSKRIKDINEVKVSDVAKGTKEDLLRYIFEERIREFATEGQRWQDMRRMVHDPIFGNTSYVHYVYNANGTLKESFTMNPNRLTLKIPAKILLQNSTMNDNP